MRIESSVTSLSWIPSEAVKGTTRLPFEMGMAHYDPPPPDVLGDLDELRKADRFRFVNQLWAWIEVEAGKVVDWGHAGGGLIGSTTVRMGPKAVVFQAVAFPDIQPEPEVSEAAVRFVRTAGGRTGVPAPRTVRRPPFVQVAAPLAWSTLAFTTRVDGTSEWEVPGASPSPGTGLRPHGGAGRQNRHDRLQPVVPHHLRSSQPWGDEDSPALVTVAETALERELSARIIRAGARPHIVSLGPGETLVNQGDPGDSIFLLLDGVLDVAVDGEKLAEVGPGAILGGRAVLEGGRRTATLRVATPVKAARAAAGEIDAAALAEVSRGHRREEE